MHVSFLSHRSGNIPAFGDWEKANEMPITQYFESATQAGLIRYPNSSSSSYFRKSSQHLGTKRPTRASHMKEQEKFNHKTEFPRNKSVRVNPKPVDEDLYKISPHLLRSSNLRKLPGFFSCLVPRCT